MVKEYTRTQRLNQEMQKEIANILQHEIKDPRIKKVTVSNVIVSRDLSYAKIFVTFLNNDAFEKTKIDIKILQNATGFVRTILSKTMYLRVVPELIFIYDNSLIEGIRITNLVNKAIQKDLSYRNLI